MASRRDLSTTWSPRSGSTPGISKSEVSRNCQGLDEIVGAFRTRRLDHIEFPYVYPDATCLRVRNQTSQVSSTAVVIASGITATGEREDLGVDVGDSEDVDHSEIEVFWRGLLRLLRSRGLGGARLVISDQHSGLGDVGELASRVVAANAAAEPSGPCCGGRRGSRGRQRAPSSRVARVCSLDDVGGCDVAADRESGDDIVGARRALRAWVDRERDR